MSEKSSGERFLGLLGGGLIRYLQFLLIDPAGANEVQKYLEALRCCLGASGELSSQRQDTLPAQYAEAVVWLVQQLSGEFDYEVDGHHVTFTCTRCPFGEMIKKEPRLCEVTCGILGWSAAGNSGYGKVILGKRIARADEHCEIRVYLRKTVEAAAEEGAVYPSRSDFSLAHFGGFEYSMEETIQDLKARGQFLEQRVLELERILEERKLIEKAKGMLMERLKLTEGEAMRRLQKESQNRNKKLAEIAHIIVQAAEMI